MTYWSESEGHSRDAARGQEPARGRSTWVAGLRRLATPSRSVGALAALGGFAALNGLLGLILAGPSSPAVAAPPPRQHAVPAHAPGALREFAIEAREANWEIFPGAAVKAWTYNGQVPGPEIRVTEGDIVRVTLKNSLPEPTTIHWHGIDVPNNMDGIPGITQDAVPPGGTFVYEFIATNPGTRWYHSHQDSEIQVPLGLYGPMIVEPAAPVPGEPTYDREYTYVLSEWSLALTPDVATGKAALPRTGPGAPHSKQLDFDFFLFNGRAHEAIAPVVLSRGERVRIRLINAGSLVHTIHTHGHSFKIVATDGNAVPAVAQLTKDSVTLGPSERVDIELLATNPGVWVFHCHMEHHMANGMMTTIQYEGVQPVVQGGGGHGAHGSGTPATQGAPASAPPPPAAGTGALPEAAAVPQNATKVSMVDNRFQPASLTVRAGTTLAWINNGANVHTVSARDGSVDSGAILPGKAFVHTFSAPGTYQFLCRQHLLNGMTTSVVVQ